MEARGSWEMRITGSVGVHRATVQRLPRDRQRRRPAIYPASRRCQSLPQSARRRRSVDSPARIRLAEKSASAWGCSSVGRAPEWHSGGRRFDPDQLHQPNQARSCSNRPTFAATYFGLRWFHTITWILLAASFFIRSSIAPSRTTPANAVALAALLTYVVLHRPRRLSPASHS